MSEPKLYKRIISNGVNKTRGMDEQDADMIRRFVKDATCYSVDNIGLEKKRRLVALNDSVTSSEVWKSKISIPNYRCFFETDSDSGILIVPGELGENFHIDIDGDSHVEDYVTYRMIFLGFFYNDCKGLSNNDKADLTPGPDYSNDGPSPIPYIEFSIDKEQRLWLHLAYHFYDNKGDYAKTEKIPPFRADPSALIELEERYPNNCVGLMVFDLMVILSWLNAKNIKVQANDFSSKFQKHVKKRLGIDDVKYHTLVVTKPGKQYESVAGYNEKKDTMPLHLCRGHLKHYSEEKPLFGKYSGTFFVHAHVRGNKKNGEIKKDYKLKVAK